MEAHAKDPRGLFHDRVDAGRHLARDLSRLAGRSDVLVLALPRGGVPVAQVVATSLGVPWDVLVARKLGVPGIPEAALGAIAEGYDGIVEEDTAWYLGVPTPVMADLVMRERRELDRRIRCYRGGAPGPSLRGRTVVLVDDGLSSGATLHVAAKSVRAQGAATIVAAVPVAWEANTAGVRADVDQLVALQRPEPFGMVSDWYRDFSPVTDDAVLTALGRARLTVPMDEPRAADITIRIPTRQTVLEADLELPDGDQAPAGLVILAHGGGSSRGSFRNRYLAGRLRLAGWATVRVDLLTEEERVEDRGGELRFDVRTIGGRLADVAQWAAAEALPGAGRIVLMGASTGAGAAMIASATRSGLITAVVSRGGRVDLAEDALRQVRAPSLLIVGANDRPTRRANQKALKVLPPGSRLAVVANAGHTFEEPGALGQVGELTVSWLDVGRGTWDVGQG